MEGVIQNLDQLEIEGRRIFIRVDFNVPLINGEVSDIERIEATVPTIKQAINRNAHVILASHLGRPDGYVDPAYSLRPVARVLSNLIRKPVRMTKGVVDDSVLDQVRRLGPGEILLLENLRFHPGETANDPAFAAQLRELTEVYVNDAFGVSHRAHASVHALPAMMREVGCGLLVQKELLYLEEKIADPVQPFVCIFGGAKVDDKIGAVRNMLPHANHIIIGGGMSYTFLAALGYDVGKSIFAEDKLQEARDILEDAQAAGVQVHLPIDHVVTKKFAENSKPVVTEGPDIEADMMGLDIGPKTVAHFSEVIAAGRTILWNGPMGVFEWDAFAQGSLAIARAVGASRETTIVGGGDSIALIHKAGVAKSITHVSTGGGAMLSFISGEPMPGIDVLKREL